MKILDWILRITAAGILAQTLFFKFMGAAEPVYIFTKLGVEPWGRIGTGVFELLAAALLLIPATVWVGALLGLGLMAGAILAHLTTLGIVIDVPVDGPDGGALFMLAIIVFLCSLVVLYLHRRQIPVIGDRF